MFDDKSRSLAGLLPVLALCACASTAPGVTSNDPTYVDSVEIVEHDTSAPTAFADSVRGAVLTGAAFYGTTGRPIIVKIDLDKVHFKNALRALTIGDDNQAEGRVAVYDSSSGERLAVFAVHVDAETSGLPAASIALAVLGAFDPTGAVDIASTLGSAASADINRSGAAAGMRSNFAAETLRQTFGDVRTRAVTLARQNQARQRGQTNTPGR